MSNVSILFADVVGFTRMSSNKTAEQLVDLLNDLFERFDLLCEQHELEKISTLGDCYYCVAGCPEPMPDHAHAAVQMGLDMIRAIAEFDRDRNEGKEIFYTFTSSFFYPIFIIILIFFLRCKNARWGSYRNSTLWNSWHLQNQI